MNDNILADLSEIKDLLRSIVRLMTPHSELKQDSRAAFEARQAGPQPDHEPPIWATVRIGGENGKTE